MWTDVSYGNFQSLCQEAYLPVCNLYSDAPITRNCQLTGFQVNDGSYRSLGDVIVAGISAVLIAIIIYRTHSKKAAVGRKEMTIMLMLCLATILLQILSVGDFISPGSLLQVISAVHIGCLMAVFWTLLLNGLVGYQFVEDGSVLSVIGVLGSGLAVAAAGTLIALDVAQGLLGGVFVGDAYTSVALFTVYLILPLVCTIGYLILQTVLVARNLGDQRPLINLYLAALFFAASQAMSLAVNTTVCDGTGQQVDGAMFASVANMGAIIYVYRFWDSITEDDWDSVTDIFA